MIWSATGHHEQDVVNGILICRRRTDLLPAPKPPPTVPEICINSLEFDGGASGIVFLNAVLKQPALGWR
jgi:hypothetical protein